MSLRPSGIGKEFLFERANSPLLLRGAMPNPDPPWPHERAFEVEYRDVDVLGHLNHAAYFRYMETLRCEYYLRLKGESSIRDLDIIILEATCRYLSPAPYGDRIVGEVVPAAPLGTTSFTLLYRFRALPEGTERARGRTVIVAYDYRTGRKKPLEPSVREGLATDSRLLPDFLERPPGAHAPRLETL